MSAIREIIRNIVALLLVAAALELILPDGKIAKFVRLAVGLMMVATIITPFVSWDEFDFSDLIEVAEIEDNSAAYAMAGAEISEKLEAEAEQEYSRQLAQQMAALAMLADGVEAAAVQLAVDSNGAVTSGTLYLQAEDAAAEKALTLISNFYLVDKSLFEIVIKEGDNG